MNNNNYNNYSIGQQYLNEGFRPKRASAVPQFDIILGAILSGIERAREIKSQRAQEQSDEDIYASGDIDSIARINPQYANFMFNKQLKSGEFENKERERLDRLELENKKLAQSLQIAMLNHEQKGRQLSQKSFDADRKEKQKRLERLQKVITDPESLAYLSANSENLDEIEQNLEPNRNWLGKAMDTINPMKNPMRNNFRIAKSLRKRKPIAPIEIEIDDENPEQVAFARQNGYIR